MLLLALTILLTSQLPPAFSAASAQNYNILQVSVQPTNSSFTYYSVTVYNMSGTALTQSSGYFPEFAFQLPSGRYMITALAESQYGYPLSLEGKSSNQAAQPSTLIPFRMQSEYGYAIVDISSSEGLTIKTYPSYNLSTHTLEVSLSYPDGTPVQDAYVYASVIGAGGWYWWNGGQNKLVMWGQTDTSGRTELVVPTLPLEVTAWVWVPIKMPENITTISVNVAGERINVSVYYQPVSAGFSAVALVMPSQATLSMTLHYQQQNYWVYASAQSQLAPLQSQPSSPTPFTQPSLQGQNPIPYSVYNDIYSNPPVSIPQAVIQPSDRIQIQPSYQSYLFASILIAAAAILLASIIIAKRRK